MEKNKDFSNLKEKFDQFDTDKDGFLNMSEIMEIFRHYGLDVYEATVKKVY